MIDRSERMFIWHLLQKMFRTLFLPVFLGFLWFSVPIKYLCSSLDVFHLSCVFLELHFKVDLLFVTTSHSFFIPPRLTPIALFWNRIYSE